MQQLRFFSGRWFGHGLILDAILGSILRRNPGR
jgi:hypothetical protein